jgi:hypothetical protein
MSYVAGDQILDDEYNIFSSGTTAGNYGINYIAGVGEGNLGLGQTEISTITVGDTINASQWNSLFGFMDNIANHVNETVTSTAAVAAGDTIAIKSALNTNLQAIATAVQGGSVNASGGLTTGSTDLTQTASAVFDTSHVAEASFTFVGGDEARWFFNAGGKLRLTMSNAATNNTGKDSVVSTLMSEIGTFTLGATTSAVSGTLNITGGNPDILTEDGRSLGYYDLTTSYQTIILYTESSGTYDGSYDNLIQIKIEAKTSAPDGDGRGNNGTTVHLKASVLLNDTVRTDYGAGNIAGTNVEANAAGPTSMVWSTVDPNTTEGLSTVYTSITVAQVNGAAGQIVNAD